MMAVGAIGAAMLERSRPVVAAAYVVAIASGLIAGESLMGVAYAAMVAGETGVDYLVFGGLFPDGVAPDADEVRERATWWAEIFETPCIAVAAAAGEVAGLVATGAEFVGLESALWLGDPEGVRTAQAQLDTVR